MQARSSLTSGSFLSCIEEEELSRLGHAQPPGLRQPVGALVLADRVTSEYPKDSINIALVLAQRPQPGLDALPLGATHLTLDIARLGAPWVC